MNSRVSAINLQGELHVYGAAKASVLGILCDFQFLLFFQLGPHWFVTYKCQTHLTWFFGNTKHHHLYIRGLNRIRLKQITHQIEESFWTAPQFSQHLLVKTPTVSAGWKPPSIRVPEASESQAEVSYCQLYCQKFVTTSISDHVDSQ